MNYRYINYFQYSKGTNSFLKSFHIQDNVKDYKHLMEKYTAPCIHNQTIKQKWIALSLHNRGYGPP